MNSDQELEKLRKENLQLKKRLESNNDTILANAIPLLVSYMDTDLRYTFVNQAYEKWFNVKASDLIGKTVKEFVGDIVFERALPHFKKALAGEKVEFKQESPYASGTKNIHVNYIPDKDPETGQVLGVIALVNDITAQEQLSRFKDLEKKKVEETNNDLIEEKKIREKFVSTLTHDLRTPLTAASLTTQVLLKKYDDQSLVDNLKRVKSHLDRADRMITDLLDANSLRVGENIPVKVKETSLKESNESVCEGMKEIYGPRLEVEYLATHTHGIWDESALQRIWENLIGNAFKYGSLHTPVKVTVTDVSDGFRVSVHNEGNPISEKDQTKLFQTFSRLDKDIAGDEDGWGIGLSVVRALTLAHGGKVELNSSAETGTDFIITLPKS